MSSEFVIDLPVGTKAECAFRPADGLLGDYASVVIGIPGSRLRVMVNDAETARRIAEQFLDAATLLGSAKPKPSPLHRDPSETITHKDGVKAGELPL
jgi:hypothetical protein